MAGIKEGGKRICTDVNVNVAWLLVQSKREKRIGRRRQSLFVDEVHSWQSGGRAHLAGATHSASLRHGKRERSATVTCSAKAFNGKGANNTFYS